MEPLNVVILQGNSRIAQSLVSALSPSFRTVHQVRSPGELRACSAKNRAEILIVDMETIPLSEVERLSGEFPDACIVCTHRLADEEMWTAALAAGASDVCPTSDTHGILKSVLRNTRARHAAAA